MKITRSQLKKLIKEEICRLQEQDSNTVVPPISTSPPDTSAETPPQLRSEPELENMPSRVTGALTSRMNMAISLYNGRNLPIRGRLDITITFDEKEEPVVILDPDASYDIKNFFEYREGALLRGLESAINSAVSLGELDTSKMYVYNTALQ